MHDFYFIYETLMAIERAIYEHAEPRIYDWLIVCVGAISIISAVAVAVFAHNLNKAQKNIAEKQAKISGEQANIAKKQADIMDEQNKIALFEKRFFYFKSVRQFYLNCVSICDMPHEIAPEMRCLLKGNTCTDYHAIKISAIALLIHKIIKFDQDDALAKHNLHSYSITKLIELVDIIRSIQYVFFLSNYSHEKLTEIVDLLLKIVTDYSRDDDCIQTLNHILKQLNTCIEDFDLCDGLEAQLFLLNKHNMYLDT